MFYVYILKNNNNKLYIGQTVNVEQRINRHNNGRGAVFTSGNQNFQLVHSECFCTLQEAVQREKQLKNWSRAKKEALINGNFDQLKRL